MLMMSISHPVIRFPLILLLLAFAWWASKTGLAGLYSFQANSYLELWQHQRMTNPQYTITDSQYQELRQKHQQILSFTHYNGDFWTSFAQMQFWYLYNTPQLTLKQQLQFKDNILSAYRTAISLRPTWPYTFADFAVAKANFGEYDAEFIEALNKANQLGARESYVIHTTLELGLAAWNKLPISSQKVVANAVERSVTWQLNDRLNQKERIFALSLVGYYQKLTDVCALMTTVGQQKANCPTTKPS